MIITSYNYKKKSYKSLFKKSVDNNTNTSENNLKTIENGKVVSIYIKHLSGKSLLTVSSKNFEIPTSKLETISLSGENETLNEDMSEI